MDTSMLSRASAEVVDLHRFFVDWFDRRRCDQADFGRFERVMGEGFSMVPPSGELLDRDAVIGFVRASRASLDGDFAISIEDIQPGWQAADLIILTYIEAQRRAGQASRRRSSAVFTPNPSTPYGVEWRHLHETWLEMPRG